MQRRRHCLVGVVRIAKMPASMHCNHVHVLHHEHLLVAFSLERERRGGAAVATADKVSIIRPPNRRPLQNFLVFIKPPGSPSSYLVLNTAIYLKMQAPSIASCRSACGSFTAFRRPSTIKSARKNLHVCNAAHKIAVLSGDGIGPEIMAVALQVLKAAGEVHGEEFIFNEALIGGAAIDAAGDPYPASTQSTCKASDAVLLAAIGGYVAFIFYIYNDYVYLYAY